MLFVHFPSTSFDRLLAQRSSRLAKQHKSSTGTYSLFTISVSHGRRVMTPSQFHPSSVHWLQIICTAAVPSQSYLRTASYTSFFCWHLYYGPVISLSHRPGSHRARVALDKLTGLPQRRTIYLYIYI